MPKSQRGRTLYDVCNLLISRTLSLLPLALQSLKSHGSTLIVRTGFTPSVVKQVVASVGADSIYMSQEVMSEELAIEKAMLEELGKLPQKVAVQRFWANTLYDKADLPFDASSHRSMPQIYTQFRKAVESKGRVQEPLPVPLAMKVRGGWVGGRLGEDGRWLGFHPCSW